MRSIFEVCTDLNYQHLKSIKLWRVRANNEGVRNLCNFILKTKTIEHLDLLDNGITALGCEFLGKVLHPFAEVPIKQLILDHNPIGTEGLMHLADGFCMNSKLEELSLNFCSIDGKGAKYVQQLLAFIDSNLKVLKMQGNLLKNTGVISIMEALEINRMLDKLVLADNQIGDGEEQQVISKFIEVLKKNDNLMKLDVRFNGFYEDEFKRLFDVMKLGYLTRLKVTEQLPKLLMDEYLSTIKKNEKFVKKLRKKRNKKKKKKK